MAAALLSSAAAESSGLIAVRVVVVDAADEAARILQQLKAGADFAALARDKSTDATSVDGGLLGRVDPAMLRPELRDALHDLRPGELSRILKLPSGYAILKIVAEPGSATVESADPARQTALAAPASIQYGPDVDGLQEAWSAISAIHKPAEYTKLEYRPYRLGGPNRPETARERKSGGETYHNAAARKIEIESEP